jgi:hypothetical protein
MIGYVRDQGLIYEVYGSCLSVRCERLVFGCGSGFRVSTIQIIHEETRPAWLACAV